MRHEEASPLTRELPLTGPRTNDSEQPLTLSTADLQPTGRQPLNHLVHQDAAARKLVEELIRYNPQMAQLLAALA